MSASVRSSPSLTTSRALRSADGSIRMSSGASAAYEKPRSRRSSCIDETPRSSRIASARLPFPARCSRTVAKSPARKRTVVRVSPRRRSTYGATVGSRSIAISLPSPQSRSASRRAWPPAPNVASTTVSPGRGARAASTSSASTGTWSVVSGKLLGNILRSPFDLLHVCAPCGAIPDLEVVVDAGDGDLATDFRPLEEHRGDHHPALFVERRGDGAREEETLHLARGGAEIIEAADPRGKVVPLAAGVGVEAAVHPPRDDDVLPELLAKPRREREPVLVVE